MPAAPAASILDILLGLAIAPAGQDPGNRLCLEGLTLGPTKDDGFQVGIRRLQAASLRIASGPLLLELDQLALDKVVARIAIEDGRPHLRGLEAAGAELSGVKVHGPATLPAQATRAPHAPQAHAHAHPGPSASGTGTPAHAPATAWNLGPLSTAEGTVRAEIVDAHLLFDADVTVRIRGGEVDFGDATVEHVGPDSRMGVSRLGIYVDAPNGRSYLYQFASAPVAGVEYERRGAMLGPWVTDRGKLRLQPFGEGVLREARAGQPLGLTEQARLLFDRTAVAGDVQLGDGIFAAPGVQAELAGRAGGRNLVRLHSEAVGRGLTLSLASLSVRNAVAGAGGAQVACDEAAGSLMLRVFVDGAQLRFALELATLKLSGPRLQLRRS